MKTICKPMVNKSLDRMNGLQRTAETFRYSLLSVEFFISPDGSIRKWVRANIRLAVFIAAPTFMAFPVVTVALWELESWIDSLTTIASKLVVLPFLALLALVSISIVLKLFNVLRR